MVPNAKILLCSRPIGCPVRLEAHKQHVWCQLSKTAERYARIGSFCKTPVLENIIEALDLLVFKPHLTLLAKLWSVLRNLVRQNLTADEDGELLSQQIGKVNERHPMCRVPTENKQLGPEVLHMLLYV